VHKHVYQSDKCERQARWCRNSLIPAAQRQETYNVLASHATPPPTKYTPNYHQSTGKNTSCLQTIVEKHVGGTWEDNWSKHLALSALWG